VAKARIGWLLQSNQGRGPGTAVSTLLGFRLSTGPNHIAFLQHSWQDLECSDCSAEHVSEAGAENGAGLEKIQWSGAVSWLNYCVQQKNIKQVYYTYLLTAS